MFYKKGVVYDWIKNIRGGGNLELTPQGFRLGFSREWNFLQKFRKLFNGTLRHKPCNVRFGFTLAEVLITLGIIGVVVAMTMPALIARHQEKVWTTSYLRVYSILDNAYRRVQEEYGTFENWSGATITINSGDGKPDSSLSDRKKLYEYMIKPYIEINEAYLPKNDNWNWVGSSNCWPETSYYLNKTPYGINTDREYINKPAVSLKSGECIVLSYFFGDFMVDINSKKGPNTLGKDQFAFSFDAVKKERIKPGYYQRWWTDTANYCDVKDSHGWHAGSSCGFWIVRYQNMDYLHLPFDEVKRRWRGGVW